MPPRSNPVANAPPHLALLVGCRTRCDPLRLRRPPFAKGRPLRRPRPFQKINCGVAIGPYAILDRAQVKSLLSAAKPLI